MGFGAAYFRDLRYITQNGISISIRKAWPCLISVTYYMNPEASINICTEQRVYRSPGPSIVGPISDGTYFTALQWCYTRKHSDRYSTASIPITSQGRTGQHYFSLEWPHCYLQYVFSNPLSWWRPCVNRPITGGFPSQSPVKRNFDVIFDLRLNKWLKKQSKRWWFEAPSRSLWRHCDVSSDVHVHLWHQFL